jgi:hypothetical protein
VLCFDAMLVQMQCWGCNVGDAMLVMVCFDHFNVFRNNNKHAQKCNIGNNDNNTDAVCHHHHFNSTSYLMREMIRWNKAFFSLL